MFGNPMFGAVLDFDGDSSNMRTFEGRGTPKVGAMLDFDDSAPVDLLMCGTARNLPKPWDW
jgi:hypothetical protein